VNTEEAMSALATAALELRLALDNACAELAEAHQRIAAICDAYANCKCSEPTLTLTPDPEDEGGPWCAYCGEDWPCSGERLERMVRDVRRP
jgi:hypothetical protein